MPSNLKAIVEGIAAQLRETGLFKKVLTYKPNGNVVYPMVFFQSLHLDYPETTYGEMTLGYDLVAYVVLAPIDADDEKVSIRLFDLVPVILEAIGHDLDAHGALNRAIRRSGESYRRGRRRTGDCWHALVGGPSQVPRD